MGACPECGEEVKSGAPICHGCGARLNGSDATIPAPASPPPSNSGNAGDPHLLDMRTPTRSDQTLISGQSELGEMDQEDKRQLQSALEAMRMLRAHLGRPPLDFNNVPGSASKGVGISGSPLTKQELDDANMTALLNEAAQNINDRKFDRAHEAIKWALSTKPKHSRAWYLLGRIKRGKGDQKGALAAFDEAIANDETNADAHCFRGMTLATLEQLPDAIDSLVRAVTIKPDDAFNWFHLAEVNNQAGKITEAVIASGMAVKYDPKDAAAWFNRGIYLRADKDFREAARALDIAAQLDPKDIDTWRKLSDTYVKLDDWPRMVETFTTLTGLVQDDGPSWAILAAALKHQKDYKGALAAYGRAAELDPKNFERHYLMANCRYDSGDYDGAIRDWQKTLKLNPRHHQSLNNMGNAFKRKGELEKALAMYKQAVDMSPGYALGHENLGEAYSKRGDWDPARECFVKAFELYSTGGKPKQAAVTAFKRARFEAKLGLAREMAEWLQKAVAFDPALKKNARSDPDFASMHEDPAYKRIVG